MARKQQAAIQETVENNEDFETYLETHKDILICLEVYSEFCGPCLATSFAIRKGKMEIGQDKIGMVKACADNIDALSRFKGKSEPAFLFIRDHKLLRAVFGANGIELCRVIEEELKFMDEEFKTGGSTRHKYEISDHLPEEEIKLKEIIRLEEEYRENSERLRVLTLAARKKRVNERLSRHIKRLNFILFWPSCHQAHYDLYEKWDMINVQVAAKETFQLTEEDAREAMYMSDVDLNDACLYELLKGEILVVLFKMLDTDMRDFIQLMRYALYEEIPIPKEDVPPEKQIPPIPAYERYASISKTAREVRRDRYNIKLAIIAKEKEEADRLAAEQARLAREAAEDAARLEKQRKEEEKMARIQAGLPAEEEEEPPPEDVEGEETEKVEGEEVEPEVKEEEEEEVFQSDVEVEGEEYIPPGGLFVPGLYSPPNELAKANGLSLFYPKAVLELAQTIETEFLPPHVLIMFPIDKRHDIKEVMDQYASEILNIGFFVGDDPYNAEHIAFTMKQYDKLVRKKKHLDRMAVMVSRKRSLPMLQLAVFNPVYISADVVSGEKECLTLFPVGYGDDYEDEESVHEEEVVVKIEEPPPAEVEEVEELPPENEDQEDED
ncbi:unnamed protein product [Arctia plantaginis]|uniref:DUF4746 domain-containing protein n=1 Tax=Arctia plantaginis TaxID=874455 RepID=A0A8S1AXN0_ARCPL|nr:unnamed protein product [Arctia plantaginis]